MLICPECQKELSGKRALAGHLWLAHQKRPGWKWELTTKVRQLEAELQQTKLNLDAASNKTAAMSQEVTRLKRWASDDPGKCLACGGDLTMFHKKDVVSGAAKGTVFICGH